MATYQFLSELPPPPSSEPNAGTGVSRHSLQAVEHRLACAERELRIQFTRIAQLQAELDLLLAALRRSPGGAKREARPHRARRVPADRTD